MHRITMKEAFGGRVPADDRDLVTVSDALWKLGSAAAVRSRVTPELFRVHIASNTIGSWQCDGWHEIISSQPALVPFIPDALGALGLENIVRAFQELLAVFPSFSQFTETGMDGSVHCDTVNFVRNAGIPVSDPRFRRFSAEERQAVCRQYRARLDALENMSQKLWGYRAPGNSGWDTVTEYVRRHFEK